MEVKSESENVSFLALLMAPDNSPIEDPYDYDNSTGPTADYFSGLPDLLSLETLPPQQPPSPPPPPPPISDGYSLSTILTECIDKRRSDTEKKNKKRSKRVKIREKMFELRKIMPAEYGLKKTMSETLEAARKYVRFLKAQEKALETMPTTVSSSSSRRQRMVEVVVNSEKAQVALAERGLCVVSAEQVAELKRVELRKKVVRQLLGRIPF